MLYKFGSTCDRKYRIANSRIFFSCLFLYLRKVTAFFGGELLFIPLHRFREQSRDSYAGKSTI